MAAGDHIRYRSGYKYQLVDDYSVQVSIYPEQDISTDFITLSKTGLLSIFKGYAWDGPSGPTFDTKTFMRGSLVHDAIAQLMRLGLLDTKWFTQMNRELQIICLEDDMSSIRATWVFYAVEYSGGDWAKPGTDGGKHLEVAP